jgi:hypothetical protein
MKENRLAKMRRQSQTCRRSSQKSSSLSETSPPETRLAVGDALWEDYYQEKGITTEHSDEDIEEQQTILQGGCPTALIPTSANTKLAQAFISSLGHLHMQTGFCILVPSYIGQSKEVDLAAQAVITAIECQKHKNSTIARSAYHRYGQALAALQKTISFSDESLMAVALLSMYEGTMRMHTPAQFSHRYGIARIMLSRKKRSTGPNELERALLYSDWDRRLRAPVALGMVSPFEDPYWWDAAPRTRHTPPEVVKLRMLTNQLYIRLPRLILYVRRVREGVDGCVSYLEEEARQLADDLLQLRDKEAESTLLHGVKVVKTKDQWDVPIVRYSFEYQTLQQMAFATAYWHARLILMQLCLQLLALPNSPQLDLYQSEEELKAETKRMLTNIFMSYQHAKTLSMMGHICIAQPLVASFGAISCLDCWQDLPISSVKTWIVLRMNDSWGKWGRSFNSRDLEEINQVFSGGPLEGVLPRTYEDERQLFEMSADFGKG